MESDIQSSIKYHAKLSDNDKLIIESYTKEINPDDWPKSPIPLEYQTTNFFLKYINASKPLDYDPILIKNRLLQQTNVKNQVQSAQRFKCILNGFPPTTVEEFPLYRGFLCEDLYFLNSSDNNINAEIIVPYFLSTSINPKVAYAFTMRGRTNAKGCLWRILIPKGTPLPYIASSKDNCGECEVVLNVGATLKLIKKETVKNINLLTFKFIGYSKASSSKYFWSTVLHTALEYACELD